ncbi:MAG: pilus assembly PilX N-terminal domain-containing protein, partial [Acidobacteriota bacterium]|nr:pilus assembly PilX N-terminal domain-containing protein [Acidobacteriota bacterium]
MTIKDNNSPLVSGKKLTPRSGERGAALATAILMMMLLSAIAMTVLAVVRSETRIAGGDLKRTQTFYAAASGIEKMTSDFSALFGRTSRPTQTQLDAIAAAYPAELVGEGFAFDNPPQSIAQDTVALAAMRNTQGIVAPALPRVTMPANSPFGGLIASVNPFILTSTATAPDGTQVALTRNMNNYLIPLFQFGMFSDEDIELHPGAPFTFNGRVHANGNIYANGTGPVKFLDKVTAAREFIYDVLRNGNGRAAATSASMDVLPGPVNAAITQGSMFGGPNIAGSPAGTVNGNWKTNSVQAANGTANQFGGQLLTASTGAALLKLPMQLDGNPTREIIKRRLPTDSLPAPASASALADSRYHSKAEIRILIDNEGVTNDAAGLYGSQNGTAAETTGVNLSGNTIGAVPGFIPSVLPAGVGKALWRFSAPLTTAVTAVQQQTPGTASIGWANT